MVPHVLERWLRLQVSDALASGRPRLQIARAFAAAGQLLHRGERSLAQLVELGAGAAAVAVTEHPMRHRGLVLATAADGLGDGLSLAARALQAALAPERRFARRQLELLADEFAAIAARFVPVILGVAATSLERTDPQLREIATRASAAMQRAWPDCAAAVAALRRAAATASGDTTAATDDLGIAYARQLRALGVAPMADERHHGDVTGAG